MAGDTINSETLARLSEPRRTGLPEPARSDAPAPGGDEAAAALVEADLLVEDVSIDGMCGVY
jgi:mycofactocin precursor